MNEPTDADYVTAYIDALKNELSVLRESYCDLAARLASEHRRLAEYGRHSALCSKHWIGSNGVCSCGFQAALDFNAPKEAK